MPTKPSQKPNRPKKRQQTLHINKDFAETMQRIVRVPPPPKKKK